MKTHEIKSVRLLESANAGPEGRRRAAGETLHVGDGTKPGDLTGGEAKALVQQGLAVVTDPAPAKAARKAD